MLGKTYGRIHLGRQDMTKIATKKMKGLRKPKAGENGEEDDGDNDGGDDAEGEDHQQDDAPPLKRARRN